MLYPLILLIITTSLSLALKIKGTDLEKVWKPTQYIEEPDPE